MSHLSFLFLGWLGCRGCGTDEPAAAEPGMVCAYAESAGEPGWGDANHDSHVDISDVVRTVRALLDGGPSVACLPSQDVSYEEGLVDVGDALGLLFTLFAGTYALPDDTPACAEISPMEEAPCGRMLLSVSGPSTVEATAASQEVAIDAQVVLQSPDLAVEAWSFGVAATGCTFVGATEQGTAAADSRLDPAGRRDDGWLRTDVAQDHVVSSGMIAWVNDVPLPPQEDPWPLLHLDVRATAPGSGCGTCTLRVQEGLQGDGQPVPVVVSVGGRSLPPPTAALEIQVCAP